METKIIKFINYTKYCNLLIEYRNAHNGKYPELLVDDKYVYCQAGGDDWRKVDVDDYHLRESCDTNNAFIFNTSTKEFAIVSIYLYDDLVNFSKCFCSRNRIEHPIKDNAKQIMENAFNESKYKGSFDSFNLKNNKATKMTINI